VKPADDAPSVNLADLVPSAAVARAQIPRSPNGLKARGRRFWRETVAEHELSRPELALLEQVCVLLDDIDLLHDAVRADGVSVAGSKGQLRIHPALVELRHQRQVLGRLVSQLGLEDDEGQSVPSLTRARARKAAKAANSRWRGRG
jgi:phage terminase small subunit